MVAPVEIRVGKQQRGRGIFATSTIHKDDLIYVAEDYTAYIYDEEQLVKYLTRLPPSLQCDALLWTYSSSSGRRDDKAVVVTTFDEDSLINHGGPAGTKGGRNINYLAHGSYSALVDIMEGEEILDDYTLYMKGDSVEWFDRIRKDAWGGGGGEESEEDLVDEGEGKNGEVEQQQDKSSNISLYLRQGSNAKAQVLIPSDDEEMRQGRAMDNFYNNYSAPTGGMTIPPFQIQLFDDIRFIVIIFFLLACLVVRRITGNGSRPDKNE